MEVRVRRDDRAVAAGPRGGGPGGGPAGGRDRRVAGALVVLPLAAFVVAVVLPFTTFAVASFLMGWRLQPVMSGSMAPTYPVGSLIVVAPVDPSEVRQGMAVTFEDPGDVGRLVTHRVVSLVPGERLAFRTQGDANATADPFPVPARSIRGRVLWAVPAIGYAVEALAWPRGFVLLVVLPAVALVAGEVVARRPRRATAARRRQETVG